jgi:hypothetical protein
MTWYWRFAKHFIDEWRYGIEFVFHGVLLLAYALITPLCDAFSSVF